MCLSVLNTFKYFPNICMNFHTHQQGMRFMDYTHFCQNVIIPVIFTSAFWLMSDNSRYWFCCISLITKEVKQLLIWLLNILYSHFWNTFWYVFHIFPIALTSYWRTSYLGVLYICLVCVLLSFCLSFSVFRWLSIFSFRNF